MTECWVWAYDQAILACSMVHTTHQVDGSDVAPAMLEKLSKGNKMKGATSRFQRLCLSKDDINDK